MARTAALEPSRIEHRDLRASPARLPRRLGLLDGGATTKPRCAKIPRRNESSFDAQRCRLRPKAISKRPRLASSRIPGLLAVRLQR